MTITGYYMSWFAALVAGGFFVALAARAFPLRRPNALHTDALPNPLGFLLIAAAFAIFSGLRNTIGDTTAYIYSYEIMDMEHMEPIPFRFAGNAMFAYLQYRIHLLTDDPLPLIMVTSILATVPAVYMLYKFAVPFEMGIALFVLTGYYTLSMNGIRQYVAAGILLLGAKYIFSDSDRDFIKFLPFLMIAWTFHTTALIMIPVFFISRRRAWTPMMMGLLAGTVLLTLTFDAFLPTFLNALEDTNYEQYAQSGWFTEGIERGSNIIRIFVLVIPLLLAYLWHDRLHAFLGQRWDTLVNLSMFNLAFYILSLYNWLFARLAIYTSVYVIVMMTYLLTFGVPREQRRIWYPSLLGLYIGYFYNLAYTILEYRSDVF